MAEYRGVEIRVVTGDVFSFSADLLVLKYAQHLYGVDEEVVRRLRIPTDVLPQEGGIYFLMHTPRRMDFGYGGVLFVGVEPITSFSYRSIREFARRALAEAPGLAVVSRHIALTLHGAGFGLDETEAFESEIGGIVEAIDAGDRPVELKTISIVELAPHRAERMSAALSSLLGAGASPPPSNTRDVAASPSPRRRRLDTVGYDSAGKQHAIVAMPFSDSFDDVYHYGISQPVRAAGLICERMDDVAFTGDIVAEMKRRIAEATLMIADLSEANPNVYLEVGYAWGVGTPCILTCHSDTTPTFDVRSQRCLYYRSIKKLEDILAEELAKLPSLAR